MINYKPSADFRKIKVPCKLIRSWTNFTRHSCASFDSRYFCEDSVFLVGTVSNVPTTRVWQTKRRLVTFCQ